MNDLSQLLAMDFWDPDDRRNLEDAKALLLAGNASEASRLVDSLTDGYPWCGPLLCAAAEMAWLGGDLESAFEHSDAAVARMPYSERASILLFHVLWQSGLRYDACAELRRFFGLMKFKPVEYRIVASSAPRIASLPCVCRKHGRRSNELALVSAESGKRLRGLLRRPASRTILGAELHPRFGIDHILRGWALWDAGDCNEALEVMKVVSQAAPLSETASISVFVVLVSLGRFRDACEEVRRLFSQAIVPLRHYRSVVSIAQTVSALPCVCFESHEPPKMV